MRFTPRTTQDGFTLVETLVAIAILLVVIVGPLTISTSTARSTSFASEQVVAFFLAQEGAEIMQRARDDAYLQAAPTFTNGWDNVFADDTSGPYADCYTATGCGVTLNTDNDGTIDGPIQCTGNSCLLHYDPNGDRARYNHDNTVGNPTAYTRVIKLEKLNAHEVRVISEVTWRTDSIREAQSVFVETYLFDVYDN